MKDIENATPEKEVLTEEQLGEVEGGLRGPMTMEMRSGFGGTVSTLEMRGQQNANPFTTLPLTPEQALNGVQADDPVQRTVMKVTPKAVKM